MEINKSSVGFNQKDNKPKCFCVLGVPRSGTSMVAGVLRLLGVNMGDTLDDATNEDREFLGHKGIRTVFSDRNEKESYLDGIRSVLKRNNKRDLWGWKDPLSSYYIDDVFDELSEPVIIVVTRDPVATAQGEMRFRDTQSIAYSEKDFLASIKDITSEYENIITFVEKVNPRVFFVSYEKIFKNKELFISDISEYCGLPLDTGKLQEIMKYIEPGRNTGKI